MSDGTNNARAAESSASQDDGCDASKRDLQHFLRLASAQLSHRLKQAEGEQPPPSTVSTMHMLEELIKEQIPSHDKAAEKLQKDTRLTTRTAR